MKILKIDNPRQLAPYADAWDKLLAANTGSSTIFLTQEWILNWWKFFSNGKKLSILMLFDGPRLAGMAPLVIIEKSSIISPFSIIRFIGTGVADHLDFCIDSELHYEGMSRIFEFIMNDLSWDALDLHDIPDDSRNVPVIKELLERHGLTHSIQESIVCPFLSINGHAWDSFYAARRSKSTRQDLRRRHRRLSEMGSVAFCRHEEPEDVERIFPQLFSVYDKRWENKNLSISFTGRLESLFYRGVAADLARLGKLHLLTMELDGRVIAFTLSVFQGSQFTWLITAYNPEFDKYFPGELILAQLLEEIIRSGRFNEFDFTRGDEPYKFKWTDDKRLNLRILAGNRGLSGKIPFYSLLSYSALRRRAKRSSMLRRIKLDLLGRITPPGNSQNKQFRAE